MRAEAAPAFLLVDSIPAAGAELILDPDSAHYLSRVCRARVGEMVTVTDGRGGVARARALEVGRRAVVEVMSMEQIQPTRRAVLLCGAPEGERADWLVEKLAELGVSLLQPIECERGGWPRAENRLERWRRLAAAALRQSQRCFLLEIRPPAGIAEALASVPQEVPSSHRFLADPDGESSGRIPPPASGICIGLVGPAAGLSEGERGAASAQDFLPIALSDSRLRTETAAMAWAAWWSGRA